MDGIYDSDPMENPEAVRFDRLSYLEVLQRGLSVMDSTAVSLCMENHIPVVVFNLKDAGNVVRVVCGEDLGTRVGDPGPRAVEN